MLSRTLGASMLRDMSTGKGIMRAVKGVLRAGGGYKNMDHMDKNF